MPPKKLLSSQVKKGMYVLIEDDFDDEDSEICEVIESTVVTMKGETHWHVSEGRRTVDMEETKQ